MHVSRQVQAGNGVSPAVEYAPEFVQQSILSLTADGLPGILGSSLLPGVKIGGIVQGNVRREDIVSVPVQLLIIVVLGIIGAVYHLCQQGQLPDGFDLEGVFLGAGAAGKAFRRLDVIAKGHLRCGGCSSGLLPAAAEKHQAQAKQHYNRPSFHSPFPYSSTVMDLGRGSRSTLFMLGSELLITLILLDSHTKASWKFSLEAFSTMPQPSLV